MTDVATLLGQLAQLPVSAYSKQEAGVLFGIAEQVAGRLQSDLVKLVSPGDAGPYLLAISREWVSERFGVLYLDNKHRIISYDPGLFLGTIDGAAVYPRVVVKEALAVNAAAVILHHNHPSGVAEPSEADRAITRRLNDALGIVDIRVLDHIVTGSDSWVSLAEKGWL